MSLKDKCNNYVNKKKDKPLKKNFSFHQKSLIHYLADGAFHSGADLASRLGISRSAICKQVNSLSDIGIQFNAISGKGYQLVQPIQLLTKQAIEQYLTPQTQQFIAELEILDCIQSTNSYLAEKMLQKPLDAQNLKGMVCFAEYQSAGRGRRGKAWVSPFGRNIYFSVYWPYQLGPASISGLSLAVGVSIVRALKQIGIQQLELKWPNDILWQGKKLAGILIDVNGEFSGPCSAVVGVGLNVDMSEEQGQSINQDWVDITRILGEAHQISRNQLAAILLNQLIPVIAKYHEQSLNDYLPEWREYDGLIGQPAEVLIGENKINGVVEGIDDKGMLLLSDENGCVKTFASGEVSLRKT